MAKATKAKIAIYRTMRSLLVCWGDSRYVYSAGSLAGDRSLSASRSDLIRSCFSWACVWQATSSGVGILSPSVLWHQARSILVAAQLKLYSPSICWILFLLSLLPSDRFIMLSIRFYSHLHLLEVEPLRSRSQAKPGNENRAVCHRALIIKESVS